VSPINITQDLTPLERNLWTFYYNDHQHALRLDRLERQTRATKRHGWKTQDAWQAHRYVLAPIIPREVELQVIEKFVSALTVVSS
jgi:hypothetical protein